MHALHAFILIPRVTVQGVLCCVVQMVSRELEKECVVVFDEAHNIDNVCIEALSVNLRKQTLQAARNNIRKLHDVRKRLLAWAADRRCRQRTWCLHACQGGQHGQCLVEGRLPAHLPNPTVMSGRSLAKRQNLVPCSCTLPCLSTRRRSTRRRLPPGPVWTQSIGGLWTTWLRRSSCGAGRSGCQTPPCPRTWCRRACQVGQLCWAAGWRWDRLLALSNGSRSESSKRRAI